MTTRRPPDPRWPSVSVTRSVGIVAAIVGWSLTPVGSRRRATRTISSYWSSMPLTKPFTILATRLADGDRGEATTDATGVAPAWPVTLSF